MKILLNHPEPELLRGFAQLLVGTLSHQNGEVWVISPWMKDVRIPLSHLGPHASVLGGERAEISMLELLQRVADRHRVIVITRPPGNLVYLPDLKRLDEKIQTRAQLQDEEMLQGHSIVEDLTLELNADIDTLANGLTTHLDTIRIGLKLRQSGATLAYLDHLHVKLLWTSLGAMIGSANFTNGGLIRNEELMMEVTDDRSHQELRDAAQQLLERATPMEEYRLSRELSKASLSSSDLVRLSESLTVSHDQLDELFTHLIPLCW